ncbi:hypothetical protein ANRL1_00736 [Anaerolineae bacterium]|nr:hypothetical protein ANRL1_00736 [Anaerolineae bacterium]
MLAAREKVKRLERYLANDEPVDPVFEKTMDKLIEREVTRLVELKSRLEQQLFQFENQHAIKSPEFHARFERGEMGDTMDFVEWSATYEMVVNLNKRLALLQEGASR